MNTKKIFSLFMLLGLAAMLFAQSASVSSNGPICNGELGEYYIVGTATGVVTYTLDGVQATISLDNTGNATVTTPTPPPVGVPGSICAMNSITVNGTTTGLGNQASILVNDLPAGASAVADVSPICPESDGSFTVSGPPNSTIDYDITDSQSSTATVVLDANGSATISAPSNGTTNLYFDIYAVTDPNTGCIRTYAFLANSATITKKPTPQITSVTSVSPVCIGDNKQWNITGTPNATFDILITNVGNYSVSFDNNGAYQFSNLAIVADAMNSPLALTISNLQLNGCSGDVSNIQPVELIVNPMPEVTFFNYTTANPICEGAPQIFRIEGTPLATVIMLSNGVTNTFTLDANGVSNSASQYVAGSWNLSLVSVSLDGCTVDLTGEPSVTLQVNPLPEITSVTSVSPVCVGENKQWDITGTPNATFDISISNGGNYSVSFDSNGDYQFSNLVIVADAMNSPLALSISNLQLNGCSGDVSNIQPVELIVNPIPEVTSFDYTTANPICEGAPQIFRIEGTPLATVIMLSNGVTNTFTLDTNGVSNSTSQYVAGSWNLSLVSVSLDGCTVDLTGEPSVTLQVNPLPEITSYSSNAPVCENEDLVFSFTGTPNASFSVVVGSNTYLSGFDGNGSGNLTFAAGALSPGSYDMNLVDVTLNGCTIDLSNEAPLNAVVEPTPLNSICSEAILMACTDTQFGNTSCATESTIPDAFNSGTINRKGLWYKYTGDGSTINATACNTQTDYDSKIIIFDGSCGTLNPVAWDDDGCGNLQSVAVLATTSGTEYYIFIYGHLGAVGNFGLSIGCANSPCPSSVSAISNEPLCENEIGTYTIQPSPAAAASPGAIVYYTLEGVPNFVYLDVNGEATITTPALPIGTPASILVLTEIRSASNFCPLTLSNGASITVTDCSGCPLDLTLNNDPENSGTQAAENSLQSTSIVRTTSGQVTYMAGDNIELNAGFEVEVGAEFNAIIDDCTILSLQEETTTPEAAVSKKNENK